MTRIEAAKLAKELDGVIADVEEGDGFDDVCLDTVKYVRDQLAASPKREWQRLTDEEIEQGLLRSDYALQTAHAWRAGVVFAMTKLKEKNT